MSVAICEADQTWGPVLPRPNADPHQGLILKRLRRESGRTQAAVAEAFGLSLEGYRAYEKGYSRLTVERLPRMAAALGVSPAELAARLSLTLPADASALRRLVAAQLGPDNAGLVEEIVATLGGWPPSEQQFALQFVLNQVKSWPRRATGTAPDDG